MEDLIKKYAHYAELVRPVCGNCEYFCGGECTAFSGIPATARNKDIGVYLCTDYDICVDDLECANFTPSAESVEDTREEEAAYYADCETWYARHPGCTVPPEDNCYI